MKLHYYPETDSLYIELNERPSSDSHEVADGVVANFDDAGNIVGLDIDHASQKLDLRSLETVALPSRRPRSPDLPSLSHPVPRAP